MSYKTMDGRDYTDDRIGYMMPDFSMERPGNPAERGKRKLDESLANKKIPTTVEEFMELDGLEDWPEHITSEYPIEYDDKSLFGDANDIEEYLRRAAPLEDQLAALDALETRVDNLQAALFKYADATLTDEERYSRIKNGVFYSNIDKLFKTEVDTEEFTGTQTLSEMRKDSLVGTMNEKMKKDVNYVNYPGFRKKELSELPGQLETPQLLHRVTKAQHFNRDPNLAGFAKFWKKIFLSEASVAVVQDLFWWSFMKTFKPGTQSSQDKVFDRLSDSFAALFFSINPDIRDKIFRVYPDVLSQAIFMIFFDAFPESHRMFGPLFKEEVISHCWELTTGTRPPPGSWKLWNIDSLQGKLPDGDGKVAITANNIDAGLDQPSFDFDDLYKSLETLEASITDDGFVKLESEETNRPKVREKRRKSESSYAGAGPKFEKAMFNLSGLSPLISHFLNMKHMREINAAGRRVRRTEIKDLPEGKQTFQDIIDEKQSLTQTNKVEYSRLCKEAADDISRIEMKNIMEVREINRLKENTNIMFRKGGQDPRAIGGRPSTKKTDNRKAVQQADSTDELSLVRELESDESDYESEQITETED